MFAYRNGYEIDGSDASYAVATPDGERCLEILDFLLRLKTVSRKQPIRATVRKKRHEHSIRGHTEEHIEISYEETERLREILRDRSATSCTLSYTCQSPNSLYPEIRREIVEIVAEMVNICPATLHNPVFASEGDEMGELYLSLTPDGSKALLGTVDKLDTPEKAGTANLEKRAFPAARTPLFAIEISVFLGASFGIAAYTIKKLAERFPELGIDVKTMVRRIYDADGFYLTDKTIYERIEIETDDPALTLKRLASHDDFSFVSYKRRHYYDEEREETNRENLELINVPRNLADYTSPKPEDTYEFRDARGKQDPPYGHSPAANPELAILKWAAGGKHVMTVEQYVDFAQKSKDISYFTNREFTQYTTALAYVDRTAKNAPAILRFLRKNGRIRLVMDVPCGLYADVCRKYKI